MHMSLVIKLTAAFTLGMIIDSNWTPKYEGNSALAILARCVLLHFIV